jgi:uncharacterized membrane protein
VIFGLSFEQLAEYIVWFFAYSFAGWCFELLYCLVVEHALINRGFLHGPVLPIYGTGALLAVIVLDPGWNIAVQFIVACAVAGVLEYGTSWALEKLFHARWWDYSDKPFNLNGRVFPLGLITFGVLMVAVVRLVQPRLAALTGLIYADILDLVATAVLVVFVVDLAVSVVRMRSFNERLAIVQHNLSDAVGDALETVAVRQNELLERLSDLKISLYERKSLRNPAFRPTINAEALEELRRRLRR